MTSWRKIKTSKPLFQNTFSYKRRSRVATSADIIKIVTMFMKTIFKGSEKVKRTGYYVPKSNLYLHFLI